MEEGLLLCVTGIQFVNLKYTTDIGRPLNRKGRFSRLKSLFADLGDFVSKYFSCILYVLTFFAQNKCWLFPISYAMH